MVILPALRLVFHSSASSGQVFSLMASVKSIEYSILFVLVIFKVTAGPSDLTATFLNYRIIRVSGYFFS